MHKAEDSAPTTCTSQPADGSDLDGAAPSLEVLLLPHGDSCCADAAAAAAIAAAERSAVAAAAVQGSGACTPATAPGPGADGYPLAHGAVASVAAPATLEPRRRRPPGPFDAHSDTRKPIFHVMPLSGWSSDPNGPIFYNGKYHLFYQYRPDTCQWNWGTAWAHAASADLARWERLPVALAPSPGGPDADGCFTGAVKVDSESGLVIAFYTGACLRTTLTAAGLPPPPAAHDLGNRHVETQCCAVCDTTGDPPDGDLCRWVKVPAPWMEVPHGAHLASWRDPWFLQEEFAVLGSGHVALIGSGIKGQGGTVLAYRSDALTGSFAFAGHLASWPDRSLGVCWECPFLVRLTPQPQPSSAAQPQPEQRAAEGGGEEEATLSHEQVTRAVSDRVAAPPLGPSSTDSTDSSAAGSSGQVEDLAAVVRRIVSNRRQLRQHRRHPPLPQDGQAAQQAGTAVTWATGEEALPSRRVPPAPAAGDAAEAEAGGAAPAAAVATAAPHAGFGLGLGTGAGAAGVGPPRRDDGCCWLLCASPDASVYYGCKVVYWIGRFDCVGTSFDLGAASGPHVLDLGNVLYAPTCLKDPQGPGGRHIVWAFVKELRRVPPAPCLCNKYSYSGCTSLPRSLHITPHGKLFQAPLPELVKLRTSAAVDARPIELLAGRPWPLLGVHGLHLELDVTLSPGSAHRAVVLLRSWRPKGKGSAALVYDWRTRELQVFLEAQRPEVWRRVVQQEEDAGPRRRADGAVMPAADALCSTAGAEGPTIRAAGLEARVALAGAESGRGTSCGSGGACSGAAVGAGVSRVLAWEHDSDEDYEYDVERPPGYEPDPFTSADLDPRWENDPLVSGGVLDLPPGSPLRLRMFLDGSVLEVFTSSGQALTTRVYRGHPPHTPTPTPPPGMFGRGAAGAPAHPAAGSGWGVDAMQQLSSPSPDPRLPPPVGGGTVGVAAGAGAGAGACSGSAHPSAPAAGVELVAVGGCCKVEQLLAYELGPAWVRPEDVPLDGQPGGAVQAHRVAG